MAASSSTRPLRVVVTGAAADIGTSLSFMVAQGKAFGKDRKMELVLMDKPHRLKMIHEGLAAELANCGLRPVAKYTCTASLTEAFAKADVVFLCNGVPLTPGISRQEFIAMNALEFKNVGLALKRVEMNPGARILMVSEPQNCNMRVLMHYSPSTSAQSVMGLSRVDQNRASAYLARKLELTPNEIKRLTVWGNRSKNIFIDVGHAEVVVRGKRKPALDVVIDHHFIKNNFNDVVNRRQEEIERRRKTNMCLPVAVAAVQHMKEWMFGTYPSTDWSSAIVISDGSYKIEKGIPYSFPVRINAQGAWEIVQDLEINNYDLERIENQEEEIKSECNFAYTILKLRKKVSDEDTATLLPWSFGEGPKIPCSIITAGGDV